VDPAKSAVNSLQQNIASFGVIRIVSCRITVCELSAVSTRLLMGEEVIRYTIKGFEVVGRFITAFGYSKSHLFGTTFPERQLSVSLSVSKTTSLTLTY
jgi:hypothetical protein